MDKNINGRLPFVYYVKMILGSFATLSMLLHFLRSVSASSDDLSRDRQQFCIPRFRIDIIL
ncbi:hypothetical protein DPMN_159350 [Dreissena polymorpha]|uniref:Uncharacterized protein n=1 Tax=Dreissena polymorpha TaxID=45954 RepID=A0A9D4IP42_DREPO|nr:hypothetical protein DPMN_159350 [Dreissena polymorpha]